MNRDGLATPGSAVTVLSCLVFAAALIFGGGARRDVPSDFVPEFLAIPLMILAAPAALRRLSEDRLAAFVLAGLVGLTILHVIPLPPFLWSLLPGRDVALASYEAAGMPLPWAPLSLQPASAIKGAFALLPAVALFFAMLASPLGERRLLVMIALVVGVVSVPLGILQMMGGQQSVFYFYDITNQGQAVGFFANRNHFAAFLYVLLPLAAAILSRKGDVQGVPFWSVLAFIWAVCLIGLATTGSRSALILGALSVGASFMLMVRPAFPEYFIGRRAKFGIAGAALLLLALVLAMGGAQILSRFEQDPLDDARAPLFVTTLNLAWRFFPFGSGLGSFERLYDMLAPSEALFSSIANHAHNDWVESFMETGPMGLLIGFAFLVWLTGKTLRAFRDPQGSEGTLALASGLLIWLLCIHSLWDYPLRTIALSSCLAIACAFLFPAPEGEGSSFARTRTKRRRRTRRMDEERRTFPGAGA